MPSEAGPGGGAESPAAATRGVAEQAQGIFKSVSAGVQQLVTLDRTITDIGKEMEKSRVAIAELQKSLERLLGKQAEMEKRLEERFAHAASLQAERDKRLALEIELAVRRELDQRRPG